MSKFFHLFWTFSCLIMFSDLSAQSFGKLTGTVKNKNTNEAIIGATIFLKTEPGIGTSSDINGNFNLDLAEGNYIIVAKSLGFSEKEYNVMISQGETITLNILLDDKMQELKTFVTSASKFEQEIERLTISLEILKPNIIENKNTTSMDEALMQVPGVQIVDNEPQIRSGSGYSFGAGSRVLIMVDDLPLLSGDAGRPSWGFLPVENVEQVEVIKGASSVLYGSAAINGVINIRTAYPKAEPKTKIQVFNGVYMNPRNKEAIHWGKNNPIYNGINFMHSRRIGQLDLVIGGNVFNDNNYVGAAPVNPNSPDFVPVAEQRGQYENRARLNANIRYRSKNIPGLNYGVNLNAMKSNSAAALIWLNTKEGMYRSYTGALTQTLQDVFYIDPFINYYHGNSKHSIKTRYFYLNNDNDNNQSNKSNLIYSEYQFQHNFEKGFLKKATITAGLVNIYTDASSSLYKGSLDQSNTAEGKSSASNQVVYLQFDKTFFKKLTFSAGARYEQFAITSPRFNKGDSTQTSREGRPVFRSGLNYQLFEFTFLRASFGQGYRFPTIAEKFIRTAVGPISIYPSDDIRSEFSWNAELGLKQGFKIGNFKGFVDLVYFRQEYTNNIEFNFGQWGNITDPFLGLGFRSLNVGNTRVQGGELSLLGQGEIGKVSFSTLAGYTYSLPVALEPELIYAYPSNPLFQPVSYNSSSSNTENNILKYRFQHLIKGDLEIGYKKVNLGLSFRYNSFMQNIDRIFEDIDDPAGIIPVPTGVKQYRRDNNKGDYVFDLRFSVNVNKINKVSLVINNLMNREYTLRPLVIEAPRTIAFTYTADF
jgi:outer membrane receptor protein involved in Fe transport